MAKFDTTTSEGIRDASIDRFVQLAGAKYDCGQLEHGGLLSETVTPERMEEEILDLWHYLFSYRIKTDLMLLERDREIHRLSGQVEMAKHEIYDLENKRNEDPGSEDPGQSV